MATFFESLKKWFYTKNSSAASSDARVPLLDASGNPKGSDTMANLASVLGGVYPNTPAFGGDVDTLKTTGKYRTFQATNLPSGVHTAGILVVIDNMDIIIQQYFSWDTNYYFIRSFTVNENVWQPWKSVSIELPAFYKNYADIVSLTSGVKLTMKVSQKTLIVPANGSNSELGLQSNPFIIIKADTSQFNGCVVLLCDHNSFTVLGNFGGFDDWVTFSAYSDVLLIQNKTRFQLVLPMFSFVG